MNGGGGLDTEGVCYAMLARIERDVRVLQNNMEGAFGQINALGSAQDMHMLNMQMQQVLRRLNRLDMQARETGVEPLP